MTPQEDIAYLRNLPCGSVPRNAEHAILAVCDLAERALQAEANAEHWHKRWEFMAEQHDKAVAQSLRYRLTDDETEAVRGLLAGNVHSEPGPVIAVLRRLLDT